MILTARNKDRIAIDPKLMEKLSTLLNDLDCGADSLYRVMPGTFKARVLAATFRTLCSGKLKYVDRSIARMIEAVLQIPLTRMTDPERALVKQRLQERKQSPNDFFGELKNTASIPTDRALVLLLGGKHKLIAVPDLEQIRGALNITAQDIERAALPDVKPSEAKSTQDLPIALEPGLSRVTCLETNGQQVTLDRDEIEAQRAIRNFFNKGAQTCEWAAPACDNGIATMHDRESIRREHNLRYISVAGKPYCPGHLRLSLPR